MFRFLSCRVVLSVLLFATTVSSWVAAEEPKKAPPTKEQVAQWVRDLGDDAFDKRENASKRLWQAGRLAEAALKEALKSDDPEVKRRSRELLNKFKWGIYLETPAKIVEMIQRYQDGGEADAKAAIVQDLLDEGVDGRTAFTKISAAEDKGVLDTVRGNAALIFTVRGLVRASDMDNDRALKDFDEAIQLDPKNSGAFVLRGGIWATKKDYDRALKDFDEAIRLDPKNALTFISRGRIWVEKKDYDRALKDFDEVVRLEPKNAFAFVCRGHAWATKKDHDRALKDLDEAVRLEPKNSETFRVRGHVWAMKKDHDRALKDFDEAVRLEPNNSDAFRSRGGIWLEKKDYDRALKDFDEVVRLDPKKSAVFLSRAIAWTKKLAYDRALKEYDEALRLDPKFVMAHNGKAWLLASCPDQRYRDGKKALELATRACELTQWKTPFYFDVLAVAYAELGQFDKAVEWVEKALQDKEYEKQYGDETRERLKLFKDKKPFREK